MCNLGQESKAKANLILLVLGILLFMDTFTVIAVVFCVQDKNVKRNVHCTF